jgi:hypothetical protein
MKRDALLIFALAAAATFVCLLAAGATFGLFIGGFFVMAFLAPILIARDLSSVGAATAGIGVIWLIGAIRAGDPIGQWVLLVILLLAVGFLLSAIGRFLVRFGIQQTMAGSIVILIALAWFTWPIWLRPTQGRLLDTMVNLHPPLVANGILTHESPWTEKSIAYQLTTLDQDVPIRLPTSIGPCAENCVVTGLALWWVSRPRGRGRLAKAPSPA